MGDRQDIDALLIGAVYGELDAGDKARLEDHLASHPADRAAMDSLAATRSRVRADLARMAEADPAPAISTLLLQEAARRAPRQRGGVLAWVAGLFTPIARHPAMAGALALALIGGAATVLHERGKVSATEQPVATDETRAPAAKPDVADNLAASASVDDKKVATEGYEVKLAEQQRGQLDQPDDPNAREAQATAKDVSKTVGTATAHHEGAGAPSKNARQGSASGSGYLEVTTPERKPKQLDDQSTQGFYAGLAGGAGGGGAATTTATDSAPPPAPRAAPTTGAAPGGPAAYDQAQDAKLTEWAQVQHQRLVALVKAGNCTEAGRVGSEIAARAPEYYAANVENDRAVKSCKQYIDQDKRKRANEQYKSRARNSYEPDLEQPAAQ